MRALIVAGLIAIIALALYSANVQENDRKELAQKALETKEAKEFLEKYPAAKAYVLSMPSGGLLNALSGTDIFFKRYEQDPLAQAANKGQENLKGPATIHVVSISPNEPLEKEGWIAPHPERPVLFLFFSEKGFLFARENA